MLVLGDMFDSAKHQHLAVMWHMLQGAVIHYLRDSEQCGAPDDTERMVIGSPLGTGVWQSKAPLGSNIRKGHDAFPVALKHIEEKLTGRIVEDVRRALVRGQATNNHIRVHPEQPQSEDALGYAFADILNNCAEPKQWGSLRLARDPRPVPTFGGKLIVSSVQRNKVVSLPLAGTAASPKLHYGLVGVPAHQQKRAGGIIKHNTNAVKNLAATQAVPGYNVDEGSSPEPLAKKVKQPAKPAAGVLARGRGGAEARASGGACGSRAGRQAAVAATSTGEQQAGRRGGK
eukprot:jgi/Tetstr1/438538/TSEL_027090.t1